MTKPISKVEYNRFLQSRQQTMTSTAIRSGFLSSFSAGFIKVFETKGLLAREHKERIMFLAKKYDEFEVRNYIESELIQGMGE